MSRHLGLSMKILFITVGSEIAPSSRLRVYQYLPYFKKKGIKWKIAIHPDPVVYSTEERCRHIERCGTDPSPYDKGFDRLKQNIKRRIKMARRKMILVVETLSSFRYDIVFIQKVILPAYIQRWLYFINGNLIFDFDDAIFVSPPYPAPHLLNRTLGLCRHVIVGSRFLEEYAKAYNKKVTIIPTSIDCERFTSVHIVGNRNEKPVVGWVGFGEQHLPFLKVLRQPIENVGEKYDIVLRIVGTMGSEKMANYFSTFKNVEVQLVDWVNPRDVPREIAKLDVGVMPLTEDRFAKGKCGLKALEYMAMEIPTICSPVGANADIIQDGVNGFLARTPGEWELKLKLLLDSPTRRMEMGRNGRRTVLERYSLEANIDKLFEVIEHVYHTPSQSRTREENGFRSKKKSAGNGRVGVHRIFHRR